MFLNTTTKCNLLFYTFAIRTNQVEEKYVLHWPLVITLTGKKKIVTKK